jgi:hypothetical protein
MPLHINIFAFLVAVVANIAIQMIWYSALFSKSWCLEMGYDPNRRPQKKEMFKGIALNFISSFLFTWVLAFYLEGWKFIPQADDMTPFVTRINSAISVWVGFFIPVQLNRVVWEKHS